MRIPFLLPLLSLAAPCFAASQEKNSLAITGLFVDIINATALEHLKGTLKKPDPAVVPALKAFEKGLEKIMKNNRKYTITKTERLPPNGDKHYYYSFAPYWWPDCKKVKNVTNPETQCPFKQRDGQVNPDAKKLTAGSTMYQFISDSTNLAVAYKLYDKEEYARQFALLVDTFFLQEDTYMEPNLTYAQVIRGPPSEKAWIGREEGIIDTRYLVLFSTAVPLLKGSDAFTPELDKKLKTWFQRYASWLETSKFGRAECGKKNNHATFCFAQRAAYWHYAGNAAKARAAINSYLSGPFQTQFESDGSQPEELARTLPLHYLMFNLEALTALAKLGARLGVDVWHERNKKGAGVQKAIDFVLPMALKTAESNGKWKKPDNPALLIPTLLDAIEVYGDPRGTYQSAVEKIRNATNGGESNNIIHLWDMEEYEDTILDFILYGLESDDERSACPEGDEQWCVKVDGKRVLPSLGMFLDSAEDGVQHVAQLARRKAEREAAIGVYDLWRW
ncbi:uncharacterized protein VTP21DRAFT_6341 [Calcarisporiella thermophila]|uniref:uncharacterized protein n=1 Tax=Calcarisporiella thermophila TaxID=911321 RepID=UPI003743D92F